MTSSFVFLGYIFFLAGSAVGQSDIKPANPAQDDVAGIDIDTAHVFIRLHDAISRDLEKMRRSDSKTAESLQNGAAALYGIDRTWIPKITEIVRTATAKGALRNNISN